MPAVRQGLRLCNDESPNVPAFGRPDVGYFPPPHAGVNHRPIKTRLFVLPGVTKSG